MKSLIVLAIVLIGCPSDPPPEDTPSAVATPTVESTRRPPVVAPIPTPVPTPWPTVVPEDCDRLIRPCR